MRLPKTIAGTLNAIAREAMGKDWALYATIINHWPEIVGPEFAEVTAPVKIAFPQGKKATEQWASGQRTGGILTLSLPQGLAMEFTFLSPTLIARINGFFGYAAIGKIALQTNYGTVNLRDPRLRRKEAADAAPAPALPAEKAQKLEKEVEGLENEELKNALLSLARRF